MSVTIREWRQWQKYYLEGQVTHHEFAWRVFTALDENNIQDFLDNATTDCVNLMMERLKTEPTTDEEWDRMLIAGMEWRQEDTKPTLALVRKGVEAVREHLKGDI